MRNNKDNVFRLGISFLVLSILIMIGGHIFMYNKFSITKFIEDFYANIGSELASIAITIMVVDRIVKRQEKRETEEQLKYRLLIDLHSPVNEVANNAVHDLRALKKLSDHDAWTVSANLSGKANLSDARLYDANFTGAKLVGAIFRNADLRNVNFNNADLTGAELTGANVSGIQFNEHTVLPDGELWDNDNDLIKYGVILESNQFANNWLYKFSNEDLKFDYNDLSATKVAAKNLIRYLQFKYPDSEIAKSELHFYNHWNALIEYGYQSMEEVDDLINRTEEMRNWIWAGKNPPYKIVYISFSIALENPNHLNLTHWQKETKVKILEARRKFMNYG